MSHERLGEPASVTWLQDGRPDLDESLAVEVRPDLGDDPRPRESELTGFLVHQQIEVAAPVPLLDIREAVERVRERPPDLGEQLELVDCDRGLSAPCPGRRPGDADDVAEVDVDRARAARVTEQLDPA